MLIFIALSIASPAACADDPLIQLACAAGVSSARKDQLSGEAVTQLKGKGQDTKAYLAAQEAFADYRDAECIAIAGVRRYFETEAGLRCFIRLTDARAVSIWQGWLGRPSFPPALEPVQ